MGSKDYFPGEHQIKVEKDEFESIGLALHKHREVFSKMFEVLAMHWVLHILSRKVFNKFFYIPSNHRVLQILYVLVWRCEQMDF